MQRRRSKPKRSARSYALWMLGRQAYTASRLYDRLVKRGYSTGEARDAVDYLIEIEYLNDATFATNYVRKRSLAGHGPRKLRWELKNRGVDASLVEKAIVSVPLQTQLEQAEALAKRRLRGQDIDDPKTISKLYRYLLQRGYDYNLVQDVVQKVTTSLDRNL